jgi:hypothetical protein
MTASPSPCPACGTPATGNFCSACGTSLVARTCAGCRADLSPQARFCHRCGRPAAPSTGPQSTGHQGTATHPARERNAWLVAGVLCVALLAAIAFRVWHPPAPVAPDMANAGGASAQELGSQGPVAAGPAPDISRMTPRERFDRLFNRIMQAADSGDSAQVVRFTPMALGAYAQLDSADADARYHAAVLRLQVGDVAGALALADTMLARSPGHLFGYLVRGSAADIQGDTGAAGRAGRDFLTHYGAEMRAGRVEYREHAAVIDDFKRRTERREKTEKTGKSEKTRG